MARRRHRTASRTVADSCWSSLAQTAKTTHANRRSTSSRKSKAGHTPPQAKSVDGEQAERIWRVRESALGAVTFVPGDAGALGGLGRLRCAARKARHLSARAPGAGREVRLHHARSTATSGRAASTCASASTCARCEGVKAYREFIDRAADIVLELRRLALRRTRRWPVARRAAAQRCSARN